MNEQTIELLTSAVERLTRIVTTAVLSNIDRSTLSNEDSAWASDRLAEAERDAQWRREEAERAAQTAQNEINSNHVIESVLLNSVRISYTGRGRTTGAGAFPMSQFNGFAEVPPMYSLRTTIAKLFREVPAIESVSISATINEIPVAVDAHVRENRQVAVFSQDGVYKALISVDEVPAEEIPF